MIRLSLVAMCVGVYLEKNCLSTFVNFSNLASAQRYVSVTSIVSRTSKSISITISVESNKSCWNFWIQISYLVCLFIIDPHKRRMDNSSVLDYKLVLSHGNMVIDGKHCVLSFNQKEIWTNSYHEFDQFSMDYTNFIWIFVFVLLFFCDKPWCVIL